MESAFRPVLNRILFASLALALLLAMPGLLTAQDVASLTGVVTDATGAVVPGVNVKLLDTKTNTNYDATTNSVGTYSFLKLLPGSGYKVTFTKDGFDTVSVPNLYLAVNTTHTQNAQLKIGKSSETIEVKGESSAVSLDTSNAAVGNSFDANMIHELPVQLRDSPAALLAYQPGVTTAGSTSDPNQSRNGAITGARSDQTNISLDGLDVNDFAGGFAFTIVGNAPVDSVQEFNGEVANPLSSEGRGSGGQLSLVTKSGTNKFHGALYEYYRTRGFEANDFFNDFASPVVARPPLVRNQFGGDLGGPVWKDKLFFFFNYEGRRDASGSQVTQTVPLTSFSNGNIAYINNTGGVSVLPATATGATPSVQNFDPLGIGPSPALTSFLQSRYPAPNSTAVGDGLNTGGFVFNAPANQTLNNYVARLDFNVTNNMKLFVRGSLVRETDDRSVAVGGVPSIQFPGDPLTFIDTDHSYSYVIGHTWTISNTKVNQFVYGETRQELNFPFLYAPTGTTQWTTFDASNNGGANLTSPYLTPSSQGRTVPIPIFRDDFTYVHNKHTFQFGGTFKNIKTSNYLISDFNDVDLGLGGGMSSLTGSSTQLRPADLATDPVSQNLYDSAFAFILGNFGSVSSSYNNNRQLQPLPQGTGHHRTYRYYETEVYGQDSWKATSDLTLTYGLRYQYYSVPYEVNGLEAIPNLGFNQVANPRIANGLSGNTGCPGASCGLVNPIISYSLGGKANHAPGLFNPNWLDFQPRFAFAYNPSGSGPLSRLLGDRKTVIRGGASIIDDHTVLNALNFLQDQNTWILQNQATNPYAETGDPSANLASDPRFSAINSLSPAAAAVPTTITTPYAPNVASSAANNGANPAYGPVIGLTQNPFNYAIDPNLKTPYSYAISLGFQRELPGGFQLEATYVGRFAHRLDSQADAEQTVDFKDPASGQLLSQAYANLTAQERNQTPGPGGYNVTPIPFFENQIQNFGAFGFPSGTSFVANATDPYPFRGDVADSLQLLNEFLYFDGAGINPGVGLSPQFGTTLYITNKGYSNYNGLLTTLHHKMTHGLQFDLNYTWSHSLDNISAPANEAFGSNGAGGIMCDSIHIAVCYGNSDFDVQNAITADWLYQLPIGRGRTFGSSMSRWADEVVGGWSLSGLASWRTGLAFQTVANAFPISFANNVPAIFNGDSSAVKTNTHAEINSSTGQPTIQLFQNQQAAIGAFSGPVGLEAGSRNNLRGPHYSDFDMGLIKHFPLTEQVHLEFRADAFNVFNHVNFELPGSGGTADITSPSTFGVISQDYGSQIGGSRVLQLALRLDF
ncbi:MAG: carboxypeptidase-like regulatory domain-containing protein [Candidatus Sulfotelmatobacter sp.]